MTLRELQTVKSQLQQLNLELRSLKQELLTARIKELEQMIYMRAGRPYLSLYGATMLVN